MHGLTPLHVAIQAIQYGGVKVARCLLENHAKVDVKSKGGWTPLMMAFRRGQHSVVSWTSMVLETMAVMRFQDREVTNAFVQSEGRSPTSHETIMYQHKTMVTLINRVLT